MACSLKENTGDSKQKVLTVVKLLKTLRETITTAWCPFSLGIAGDYLSPCRSVDFCSTYKLRI